LAPDVTKIFPQNALESAPPPSPVPPPQRGFFRRPPVFNNTHHPCPAGVGAPGPGPPCKNPLKNAPGFPPAGLSRTPNENRKSPPPSALSLPKRNGEIECPRFFRRAPPLVPAAGNPPKACSNAQIFGPQERIFPRGHGPRPAFRWKTPFQRRPFGTPPGGPGWPHLIPPPGAPLRPAFFESFGHPKFPMTEGQIPQTAWWSLPGEGPFCFFLNNKPPPLKRTTPRLPGRKVSTASPFFF